MAYLPVLQGPERDGVCCPTRASVAGSRLKTQEQKIAWTHSVKVNLKVLKVICYGTRLITGS